MPGRFDTFMDSWMKHRVWSLPLRMIFLCNWHRIHGAIIWIGILGLIAGKMFHLRRLQTVAVWSMAPSLLCLTLLPVLAFLLIGLEKWSARWNQPK